MKKTAVIFFIAISILAYLFRDILIGIYFLTRLLWMGYFPDYKDVTNYAVLVEVRYEGQQHQQINIVSCKHRKVVTSGDGIDAQPEFLYVQVGENRYMVAYAHNLCDRVHSSIPKSELKTLTSDNWPANTSPMKIIRQSLVNLQASPIYIDEYLRASKLEDGSLNAGLVKAHSVRIEAERKQPLGHKPNWLRTIKTRHEKEGAPFELTCGYGFAKTKLNEAPHFEAPLEAVGGGFFEYTDSQALGYGSIGVRWNNYESWRERFPSAIDVMPNSQSLFLSKDGEWYFDKSAEYSVRRTYRLSDVKGRLVSLNLLGAEFVFPSKKYWSPTEETQLITFRAQDSSSSNKCSPLH